MPKDRKKEAILLLAKGLRPSEVARLLSVSRQAVSLWLKSENFRDAVEKARKDFVTAQNEQRSEAITLLEKIPVAYPETSKTFKCALRERELLLLQQIETYLMPQLTEGSIRAAGILLKVSEARSRLLGLQTKPYELLEAFQVLTDEGCIPKSQMLVVSTLLHELEQRLRSSTDLTRAIEE